MLEHLYRRVGNATCTDYHKYPTSMGRSSQRCRSIPILHRYIRKERIRGYLIQFSCLMILIGEGHFDLNNLIILNPDVDLMTDSFIWAKNKSSGYHTTQIGISTCGIVHSQFLKFLRNLKSNYTAHRRVQMIAVNSAPFDAIKVQRRDEGRLRQCVVINVFGRNPGRGERRLFAS
ncbi:hypothetical protein BJ912DRAFT_959974 [Pholiota molesta]|nr:hypothetical protein BJ912DRAFT_959974 [Pholiota molesta]